MPRRIERPVVIQAAGPKPKLIAALGNAQEYLDLATSARDRGEREFYKRIAELYLKIAQELEAMMGE